MHCQSVLVHCFQCMYWHSHLPSGIACYRIQCKVSCELLLGAILVHPMQQSSKHSMNHMSYQYDQHDNDGCDDAPFQWTICFDVFNYVFYHEILTPIYHRSMRANHLPLCLPNPIRSMRLFLSSGIVAIFFIQFIRTSSEFMFWSILCLLPVYV